MPIFKESRKEVVIVIIKLFNAVFIFVIILTIFCVSLFPSFKFPLWNLLCEFTINQIIDKY